MDRPVKWAVLFLVGAALLWLVLRKRAAPSGDGAKPAPTRIPEGTRDKNVADDVPNGDTMTLDFLIDDVQADHWGQRMYYELLRPAGRVRESADLTAQDWRNAFGLLGLTLTRQQERSRRFQNMQQEIQDEATGKLVDQIVSTVVSVIVSIVGSPILGGLFKLAAAQQEADLQAGIDLKLSTENLAAKIKSVAQNPSQLPPAATILLKKYANGWGVQESQRSQLTQETLADVLGLQGAAREAFGLESPSWHQGYGWPTLFDEAGNKVPFPSAFFMLTRVGLLLPWQSAELIGKDYQETVNLRARALRALDILGTLMNPSPPGTVTGYFYVNKYYGPLLGSSFPPTEEDSAYTDAQGRTYSPTGQWLPHASAGAGSVSDVATRSGSVQPIDPGGPGAGSTEQFTDVPQGSRPSNVVLPPAPPPPAAVVLPPVVPPTEKELEASSMIGGGAM